MTWLVLSAFAGPLDAEVASARAVSASVEPTLAFTEPFPPCTTTWKLKTVPVPAARATSELSEGNLVHGAARAIDGDPATAWVEGVEGVGVGQHLRLRFPDTGMPAGLVITPGYAKDEGRWQKNQRVAKVLVRWVKSEEEPEQAWQSDQLEPTDTEGIVATLQLDGGVVPFGKPQVIDFGSHWIQNMESTEVVGVDLVILETDGKGAKYEDTCISEVSWAMPGETTSVSCAQEWCATVETPPPGCR